MPIEFGTDVWETCLKESPPTHPFGLNPGSHMLGQTGGNDGKDLDSLEMEVSPPLVIGIGFGGIGGFLSTDRFKDSVCPSNQQHRNQSPQPLLRKLSYSFPCLPFRSGGQESGSVSGLVSAGAAIFP